MGDDNNKAEWDCIVCNKKFTTLTKNSDQYACFQCTYCSFWVCMECVLGCAPNPSNKSSVYLALKSSKVDVHCGKCVKPKVGDIASISQQLAALKDKVDGLQQENLRLQSENAKFVDMQTQLDAVRQDNILLQNRISQLEQKESTNFHDMLTVVDEFFQRKEKKLNMVVHGLPKDDGTNSEIDQVRQLVLETNGHPDSITEVFRMGRKEGPKYDANGDPIANPSLRPVKVKCNNAWTKRGLLTGQGIIKMMI